MRRVRFPDGAEVPALGQGTWAMGEDPNAADDEVRALRHGLDLGMTLIDTAEMYGDGGAERVVGEAIRGRRDEVFLVSKAYPQNASRARLGAACTASLRRLGVERIDLYLLHWRGAVPLAETVEAMEALVASGRIGRWGVSNLDTDDMAELEDAGGAACATDQVLWNLTRRGPERDLFPWLARRGIPAMAYSPVEQGRLAGHPGLARLAADLGLDAAQLALAFVLDRPGTIAIPKAATLAHVAANRAAADVALSPETRAALDALFPRPKRAVPLEMI